MTNFNTIQYKLPKLWDGIKAIESKIDFLQLLQIKNTANTDAENFISNVITHAPILYDLYNFKGVTYTNNEEGAVPAEYYTVNEEGTAWTFNLPVAGYRIEHGVDPEDFLGVGPWEFLATVSIIRTRVVYLNLPDNYIQKTKVISFLYTDNNEPLPSFQIEVNPYTHEHTDYSHFWRWIKVADGYNLDFYAFFLYSDDVDVKLKTNVYFLDKDLGNEIQPNEL